MRPIHVVRLDESRPAVVLTREVARPYLSTVTVAAITSTIRGLGTEVLLGRRNGLDHDCVVSCDQIVTVVRGAVGRQVGFLLDDQERALTLAIMTAFDLE
ncbi:MAG: type II toxin-antitoxin system PemK/MazF family toxin [Nocardioidaceae bacterium]